MRRARQTGRPQSQTRTTGEIVRDNICTYFNLVFLVLAVMLALVHSWLNMGFLGIVFWNTLIGIVQQLRAKKTIDELTLVSARKVRCLRTVSGAPCCPMIWSRMMWWNLARATRSWRMPWWWTAVRRPMNRSSPAKHGRCRRSAAQSCARAAS